MIIAYDEKDTEDKTLYMIVLLNNLSFWKRLKYLFGFENRAFQEFIFNPEDASKLQKAVDFLKQK